MKLLLKIYNINFKIFEKNNNLTLIIPVTIIDLVLVLKRLALRDEFIRIMMYGKWAIRKEKHIRSVMSTSNLFHCDAIDAIPGHSEGVKLKLILIYIVRQLKICFKFVSF